ncbi:MAG: hypothetical protein QOE63_793 [Acidimicrobiaceae bacterium]
MDETYTAQDHAFREDDTYAGGKYELTLRWLRTRVAAPSEMINVGCGGGLFNTMAATAGYTVRGYEPDPAAYAVAAQAATPGVVVEQLGLEQIPAQPAAVVVMHDVLEHIADETGAVARVAALLRPDGWGVISVPALPSLFGYHDEQLGHHRRYTKATLRRALEPRFDIELLRYYGMSFIPVTAWFSRLRRTPYPTASGPSIIGKAFAVACRAESRVPTPIGTSLIALVRPRASSQ